MTDTSKLPKAPARLARTPFDKWCWERGVRLATLAGLLDCTPELARRIRLPFGDPRRHMPDEARMAIIEAYTEGEIGPADFYQPRVASGTPTGRPVRAADAVGAVG